LLEAKEVDEAFKSFYDDEKMLGKHFRVEWCGTDSPVRVNRHYTISNVMEPNTYDALLAAL